MFFLMCILLSQIWCGYIWSTEKNYVFPQPGCYYCCDYDNNWILERDECQYLPNIHYAQDCMNLNHQ